MSKLTKKWLVIAAVLVGVGLIVFAVAMTFNHWNFLNVSTVEYKAVEREVSEYFNDIYIDTTIADIAFLESNDEKCRVVCYEPQNLEHSVFVSGTTLKITVKDDRAWYDHIFLSFRKPKVTIYLPNTDYDMLHIDESTGDVELPSVFSFKNLTIKASTGDVNCSASSDVINVKLSTGDVRIENLKTQELHVSATTGSITVSNVICDGDVWLEVKTGTTKAYSVECQNLTSDGSTGGLDLNAVRVNGTLSVVRSTGGVKFEKCDAGDIFVKTGTGSVKGTLLSGKIFTAQSATGKVDVPQSTDGGKCEVSTSTGDIRLEIIN